MDFVRTLDPIKLIMAETALSAISSLNSPPYNLPIFLFGLLAFENQESVLSLQVFTGLVGGTTIFDISWMVSHEQAVLLRLFTVFTLLLKLPTFLVAFDVLRQRGSHFGTLNIRGGDLSGPTVWSMPGGLSSEPRDGYQPLGEERSNPPAARANVATPQPTSQPPPPPGAYQTV